MKINKYHYLLFIIILSVSILATRQMQTNAQDEGKAIQLLLTTEKPDYALGEVIGLNFEIRNFSGNSLESSKPSVHSGNLRLFLSGDGENFREYKGPNWGATYSRRRQIKIAAGESLQTKATMLHNHRLSTEHLSPLYAGRIREERIDTEFAATSAGRYWLKAIFRDGKTTIESEPLAIDIAEPVGLDAAVWERIKTEGAYAYFLQTGDIKYHPDSAESRRFVESAQQIAEEFPNSVIAERISDKLIKYNRNLENVRRLK